MAVDLKKIAFPGVDKRLKKEIRKDISEFELFLGDSTGKVKVTMPFDNELIVLDCGYISQFKFPKKSENNEFENRGPKNKINTEIQFSFNYNDKLYKIFGII